MCFLFWPRALGSLSLTHTHDREQKRKERSIPRPHRRTHSLPVCGRGRLRRQRRRRKKKTLGPKGQGGRINTPSSNEDVGGSGGRAGSHHPLESLSCVKNKKREKNPFPPTAKTHTTCFFFSFLVLVISSFIFVTCLDPHRPTDRRYSTAITKSATGLVWTMRPPD